MEKIEKYDLIERYLASEMPESELRDFEAQLASNQELHSEVMMHRELAGLFRNESLHRFLNTLHETDANWKPSSTRSNSPTIRLTTRLILGLAASLLVVVLSWQFLFDTKGGASTQQLFAAHFEPYEMVLSQRSESEPTGHAVLLNEAIEAYAAGHYAAAADAFGQLQKWDTDNVSYPFYLALSLLSANTTPEAIVLLEELLATPNHLFAEQSRWYLALAYIETDDTDKAIDVLKTIQPGQFEYSKGREIISELE